MLMKNTHFTFNDRFTIFFQVLHIVHWCRLYPLIFVNTISKTICVNAFRPINKSNIYRVVNCVTWVSLLIACYRLGWQAEIRFANILICSYFIPTLETGSIHNKSDERMTFSGAPAVGAWGCVLRVLRVSRLLRRLADLPIALSIEVTTKGTPHFTIFARSLAIIRVSIYFNAFLQFALFHTMLFHPFDPTTYDLRPFDLSTSRPLCAWNKDPPLRLFPNGPLTCIIHSIRYKLHSIDIRARVCKWPLFTFQLRRKTLRRCNRCVQNYEILRSRTWFLIYISVYSLIWGVKLRTVSYKWK